MNQFSPLHLAPLLLALGLGVAFAGQEVIAPTSDSDVGIRCHATTVFEPPPPTGMAPIRFVISNLKQRELVSEIEIESLTLAPTHSGRGNGITSAFFVPTPAGATLNHDLIAPVACDYQDKKWQSSLTTRASLRAAGKDVAEGAGHAERASDFPAIAISARLAELGLSALEADLKRRRSSGGSDPIFGSRFTPDDLPPDWRALSGFDFVMLSDREWRSLPAATKLAVLEWVRLGGRLDLYMGPSALVEDLQIPGLTRDGQLQRTRSLGGITLRDETPFKASDTVSRYHGEPSRDHQIAQSFGSETGSKADWPLLQALGRRSFASWQVVLFLVLFGILVGPVNLFVLAPLKRRHLLFITTPIISLAASAIMVGVLFFQDGIGGVGRRFVAINIEAAETRAYVTQEQVCRTGILLGTSFAMKADAVVEPVALPDTPWAQIKSATYGASVRLRLDGRNFSGDFFSSRAEQGHLIRVAVPTRARLEVRRQAAADAPTQIVSAFGFDLRDLFYADEAGSVWRAPGPVTTGQLVTLEKVDLADFQRWWEKACSACGRVNRKILIKQTSSARNQFFATAASAPELVQNTLDSIRWTDDQIVLFGTTVAP